MRLGAGGYKMNGFLVSVLASCSSVIPVASIVYRRYSRRVLMIDCHFSVVSPGLAMSAR